MFFFLEYTLRQDIVINTFLLRRELKQKFDPHFLAIISPIAFSSYAEANCYFMPNAYIYKPIKRVARMIEDIGIIFVDIFWEGGHVMSAPFCPI